MSIGISGGRHQRRPMITLALLLTTFLLISARSAQAQIVFVRDHAVWAMNDDGSGQRQLIAPSQDGNTESVLGPDKSLLAPDVFQRGGQTVVFEGTSAVGADCENCTGVYELVGGKVRRLTPPPQVASYQSGEIDPRVSADGLVAFEYEFVSNASSFLEVMYGLNTRRLSDGTEQAWSTASSSPDTNALPTPDPADPNTMAWVDNTKNHNLHEDHRNGSNDTTLASVSATSVSWSDDGSELLISNSGGISEISAATVPLPPGFVPNPLGGGTRQIYSTSGASGDPVGTARFMGNSGFVFDERGNVYTIPATCGAPNTCTIKDARPLASDGESSAPAWTSSSNPIQAIGQAGTGSNGGGGGAAHCIVPKLRNMKLSRAKLALKHANCRPGKVRRRLNLRVASGHVIKSKPAAGEVLSPGARVRLVVAR